jgi:hypothetical protein
MDLRNGRACRAIAAGRQIAALRAHVSGLDLALRAALDVN